MSPSFPKIIAENPEIVAKVTLIIAGLYPGNLIIEK